VYLHIVYYFLITDSPRMAYKYLKCVALSVVLMNENTIDVLG